MREVIDMPFMWQNTQEKPLKTDFCSKDEGIHRGIHAVMHLIEDHAAQAEIPIRFAASKVMEGDNKLLEQLKLHGIRRKKSWKKSQDRLRWKPAWIVLQQWRRCVSAILKML